MAGSTVSLTKQWTTLEHGSDLDMMVRQHGPAVQVDIFKKEPYEYLLSVDLVPCFQIGSDNYYAAKSYSGRRFVSSSGLLWRQSFSLKEKQLLEYMDRDHGCRHELLRIVKTIVNRERSSLGKLESYHLKTAFMHISKRSAIIGIREHRLEITSLDFWGTCKTPLSKKIFHITGWTA